jgi:hypothetical protein
VLNEISGDYENVDQTILRNVATMGAKCGTTIKRAEVVDALAGLIRDGLAKAYLLGGLEPTEIHGMPTLDVVQEDFETWFYITEKWMELQLSDDDWWPDEEDRQRGIRVTE